MRPATALHRLCGARLGLLIVPASLLVASTAGHGEAVTPTIAVVVGHDQAPADAVSSTILVGLFAKKRLLWGDGSPVVAVNLAAGHPVRRAFSLGVFKKTPEQMQEYWNEQYFHGVLPPSVLASEEAVLRFVATTRGAVGYVSVCNVDRRVDVIAVVAGPDGAMGCPH